eukprot:2933527-Amphidinium_carterae.1
MATINVEDEVGPLLGRDLLHFEGVIKNLGLALRTPEPLKIPKFPKLIHGPEMAQKCVKNAFSEVNWGHNPFLNPLLDYFWA